MLLIRAASFAWESTAFPMLTGTLVTAAGFMPVGFAKSIAGQYAGGIFWVVGAALILSWVVAVVFTPYLGVLLLPKTLPKNLAAGTHHDVYDRPIYRRLRGVITSDQVGQTLRHALTRGSGATTTPHEP